YEIERISAFKKLVEKSVHPKIKRFSSLISQQDNLLKYKNFISLSKTYGKALSGYPNFFKYAELSVFADKIDAQKAQKELASYLEDLKRILPYKEYMNFESKAEDAAAYFQALYDIAAEKGILEFISKYPNLHSFLAYYKKSGEIVPLLAYNEETDYCGVLFNEASKDIGFYENLMISKMASLLEPFVCASMTEKDFVYFSANADAFSKTVERRFPEYAALISDITHDARFLRYYAGNIARNSFFIENIKEYNAKNPSAINVAVAGGFHSSLVEGLKASGISYAVVSPVIKSSAGPVVYNRLLSINYPKNPDISVDIMSNALAPIPLMLVANSKIPAENRKAYTDIIVNALALGISQSEDAKILVSAENLKNVIEQWAANLSLDLSVNYDENYLNVAAGEISLSYNLKNGFIEIQEDAFDSQNAGAEPLFSVSYKAASSIIESLLKDFYKDFTNYIVNRLYEARYMQVRSEYHSQANFMKGSAYSFFIKDVESGNREKVSAKTQELIDKKIITVIPVVVSKTKEIKVVFETEFLKRVNLTASDISAAIDNALKRTSSSRKHSVSKLSDTIYIAPYDKSSSLFFGNIKAGIVGVNKALYDIEDKNLRKSLFKTGFTHEIRHKFYGDIEDKAVLDNFEEAANLEDVSILFEEAFRRNAKREDESIENYQTRIKNDIVYKLSQILSDDTSSSSKTKDRQTRFLSKIKNYVFSIDDISTLLNRKDLKNGDIWHITSKYMDSDIHSDKIEKLRSETEYYKTLLKDVKSMISELEVEAIVTNQDIYEALQKRIEGLFELREKLIREISIRRREIKKINKWAKEKAAEIEANQKFIFSSIAPMDASGSIAPQTASFEKYMKDAKQRKIGNVKNKSGIIDEKVIASADAKIASARGIYEEALRQAGVDDGQTQRLLEDFDRSCKAALRLMYYNLPEHFFRRYYTDSTLIKNHGFTHSVEVLSEMFKILPNDANLIEALKEEKMDMTAAVLGAFMHDMSCIVARGNHEQNSIYMINAVLNNAQNHSLYKPDGQG
ncbi:MAG: hypothetical protein LBU09_05375, partial [Endomicrobium sp.]|nr:hypothetical protein [Endomicrobium sp.]